MKKDLLSLLPEELENELVSMGEAKYRAAQIDRWLTRGARSFEEMSDLPKSLRDKLAETFSRGRLMKDGIGEGQVIGGENNAALSGNDSFVFHLKTV